MYQKRIEGNNKKKKEEKYTLYQKIHITLRNDHELTLGKRSFLLLSQFIIINYYKNLGII